MQIHIPYTYEVTGIFTNEKSERTTTVGVDIPFAGEIVEISPSLAPIAFKVVINSGTNNTTSNFRWYDERLWAPVPTADFGSDILKNVLALAYADRNLNIMPNAQAYPTLNLRAYQTLPISTYMETRNRILNWLDQHLLISEVLYVESNEPRYLALRDSNIISGRIFVAYQNLDFGESAHYKYFAADQLPAAQQFISDGEAPIVRPSGTIEILIPEAVRYHVGSDDRPQLLMPMIPAHLGNHS